MKVVLTDHGFASIEQEKSLLAAAGCELVVLQSKDPEKLALACADADALLVQWAPINAAVIAALRHCKVIVRYGIGVDNVDLKAAGARGIPVCNVPDYCIAEVADHALALALSLARQIPQTDAAVRSGTWKIIPPSPFPSFRSTTFATAGFGRIARAVLERARGFGFRLAAYDPFVPANAFAEAGVRRLELDALWRESGIVSLHLPLTPETRHMVGEASLSRMRNDAIVINTARGGLIDTRALARALVDKRIAGAGLDVFETEPLEADHPLRQAPNVLLTSHTAWYSAGSVPELQRKSAEAVVRAIRGEALVNVVNTSFLTPPA
ncbi:MAG: C-terminal binding protein [Opitutaceae bacterium]|nr:C-terminal binding protein [Opitutaceae bacterium]